MTVPLQNPVTTHTANGIATVYTYDFLCLDPVDLTVIVDFIEVDPSTYSVLSFGANTGGEIQFNEAPASGLSIIIRLKVRLDRKTNYQFSGDFQSPVVNQDFDRLWLSQQSQEVDLESAVKFPPGEAAGFLPSIAIRKGKALVFNATTGQPEPSEDDYNDQAANAAASAVQAETSNQAAQSAASVATGAAAAALTSAQSAAESAQEAADALTDIASRVTVVPAGNIVATNAQDALEDLDERITLAEADASLLTGVAVLVKASSESPCLIKTGSGSASISAGTHVLVSGLYKKFAVDTPIIMPTLTPGSDYSVWVLEDGTAQAVADPFSAPAAAPAANAVKIGGFHYGLVASGATPASGSFSTAGITSGGGSFGWTQSDVDKLAGINEFSIWDLTWRCKGEQRGMTFDPLKRAWFGIYFMSDSPHIHGPSAYNTNVASGTVLPYIPAEWGGNGVLKYSRLSAFEAHELVSAFGLRLPETDEFMSFAFGVTEAQSLGGAAVTIAATTRQPGYTSRIGVEQATGHQYIIGGPIQSVGGTAWADIGRGSWYGSSGLVLLGGSRVSAAVSGSRCANFSNALSYSDWSLGVRAAGDHLNLGRAAR